MADYYTQLCVAIQKVTEEERTWFTGELLKEDGPEIWNEGTTNVDLNFADGVLYLSGEEVDIDALAALLQAYLKRFAHKTVISIKWADTCSRNRPDGFGGGAAVITQDDIHWIHLGPLIEAKINELTGATQ